MSIRTRKVSVILILALAIGFFAGSVFGTVGTGVVGVGTMPSITISFSSLAPDPVMIGKKYHTIVTATATRPIVPYGSPTGPVWSLDWEKSVLYSPSGDSGTWVPVTGVIFMTIGSSGSATQDILQTRMTYRLNKPGYLEVTVQKKVTYTTPLLGEVSAADEKLFAVQKAKDPVIISLTAKVPSTPPLTRRKADGTKAGDGDKIINNWPSPMDLTFKSARAIEDDKGNPKSNDEIFKVNNAVVLFMDSDDVTLEAEVKDLGTKKVIFEARRAPDDHALLGGQKDVPTITPMKDSATKAIVKNNAKGSFQILVFIDSNGDGKWNNKEKGITLPYILIWARTPASLDDSKVQKDRLTAIINTPKKPENVRVATGGFTEKEAGLFLDAIVISVGGGKDGKRGLDRTFFGWSNNLENATWRGNYPKDGAKGTDRVFEYLFVTNNYLADHIRYGGLEFRAGDATKPFPKTGMPWPLLDPRPQKVKGDSKRDGGIEITLSTSPDDGIGIILKTKQEAGEVRWIKAIDSPGASFPVIHPLKGAKPLDTIQYASKFTARLMGWTNSAGKPGPTPGDPKDIGSVGFRTFSYLRQRPWGFKGTWKIMPGKEWTIAGIKDDPPDLFLEKGENPASAVSATGKAEVRPPGALFNYAMYAR